MYYILQEGAQNGFDEIFYLFEDRGHHGRFIITQINTRTSSTVKCCSQLVYFGLDSRWSINSFQHQTIFFYIIYTKSDHHRKRYSVMASEKNKIKNVLNFNFTEFFMLNIQPKLNMEPGEPEHWTLNNFGSKSGLAI